MLTYLLGEKLIAIGQWMAGVGVEFAWESFRNDVGNLVLLEPRGDSIAKSSVGRSLSIGDHVFVERAEDDQHIVVAAAE